MCSVGPSTSSAQNNCCPFLSADESNAADWMVNGRETNLLAHHYQICDVIEKGPICTVYRAIHKKTGQNFMIETIDLHRFSEITGLPTQYAEHEVYITPLVHHHPHIVRLDSVISGTNAIHMVFEWIDGQDICFEIVKRAASGFVYSEAVASHYTRQMVEAIKHVHSLGIVHRDLRPHNLLLANKENNAPLKIRGFGMAFKLDPESSNCHSNKSGVLNFMAPEVILGRNYGKPADVWSIGVVLYLLLSGRLPFNGGTTDSIQRKIIAGDFSCTGAVWNSISDPAKSLVQGILRIDETERMTTEQILNHEWIQNKNLPSRTHLNQSIENIRRYNTRRRLKSNIISAFYNHRWPKTTRKDQATMTNFQSEPFPGGDHSDFEFEHSQNCLSNHELSALNTILSTIDRTSMLCDNSLPHLSDDPLTSRQMEQILGDKKLQEILMLYDQIRNTNVKPTNINSKADHYLQMVKEELKNGPKSSQSAELLGFLNNPHIEAIFQTNAVVMDELFSHYSSASSTSADLVQSVPQACSSDQIVEGSKSAHVCENHSPIPSKINQKTPITPNIEQRTLEGLKILTTADSKTSTSKIDLPNGSVCTGTDVPHSSAPANSSPQTSENVSKFAQRNFPTSPGRLIEPPTYEMDSPFMASDDDDLMKTTVSRVRIIQFFKDTDEPMGITLKITEDNRCFVGRIMHGGMIHRQGSLHVGDEIKEINGRIVASQSAEALQRLLREARGQITFKIIPSYRSAPPACEIFVRAQFDYDPSQDDLIPCPQAGVPFKTGDILQVISKDDHNWWQARFVSPFPALGGLRPNVSVKTDAQSSNVNVQSSSQQYSSNIAGLIPSPELQEWRAACLAIERTKDTSCLWFNKKKKYYTTKYLRKHSDVFEQLELAIYEEVVRLPSFRRKTLVLLGAHGIGRRQIKNTLIKQHSNRFAYPILHTTRPPRKDEVDGKHYIFVSNDAMLSDIQNNEYLEYGCHEEFMYGTKLETIRIIHRNGKMAILDVEPQALKILRNAEYAPFVVFIAAPPIECFRDYKTSTESIEKLVKESNKMRQDFGHFFDYIICNTDLDETIRQLETCIEKLNVLPQWVPISWVY